MDCCNRSMNQNRYRHNPYTETGREDLNMKPQDARGGIHNPRSLFQAPAPPAAGDTASCGGTSQATATAIAPTTVAPIPQQHHEPSAAHASPFCYVYNLPPCVLESRVLQTSFCEDLAALLDATLGCCDTIPIQCTPIQRINTTLKIKVLCAPTQREWIETVVDGACLFATVFSCTRNCLFIVPVPPVRLLTPWQLAQMSGGPCAPFVGGWPSKPIGVKPKKRA